MIKFGIDVPPGFVITIKGFGRKVSPQLRKAAYRAFDDLGVERVAVRSSAVAEDSNAASWAGQLETYLNVTKEDVIEAIQNCRDSIDSKHAVEYADYNRITKADRKVAVIVQAMIDSEVSGVLFTANPVTGNTDEMLVESIYGLGELIVQGMVTPDNWSINKHKKTIVSSSRGRQSKLLTYKAGKNQLVKLPSAKYSKPTLKPAQLSKLSCVATKIEQHYGVPQDIEWAMAKKKLYIVQSRPIRGLA